MSDDAINNVAEELETVETDMSEIEAILDEEVNETYGKDKVNAMKKHDDEEHSEEDDKEKKKRFKKNLLLKFLSLKLKLELFRQQLICSKQQEKRTRKRCSQKWLSVMPKTLPSNQLKMV